MPVTFGARARGRLLAAVITASLATGALADDASMTLYVFKKGLPQQYIEVLVDGQVVAATDDGGVATFPVPPGLHVLELRDQDLVVLDQQVLANEDEVSQWIVNITRGLSTLVDVESSAAGVSAGAAETGVAEQADGEPGILAGRLVSADGGEPIAGARVFISGLSRDIRTDDEGHFEVEVPSGEYSISVLHSSFNTVTRDGIAVPANDREELALELTPAGSELPEFVVIEPYIAGSLASVLAERRESDGVTDVLSSEQISRAGDSDAAGALKRVTGLTLVGGQYIYVRGLGERYSSVLLNNAVIPSPDPTRRVVPLTLFPTDVIEAVVVQKTASANLPGDFGGGTVQLRTVSYPPELQMNLSASVGYREGTTGETGLTYEGGDDDWLGYDDGTREPPESMREALADGTFLTPFSFTNPDGFKQDEVEVFGEDLAAKSSYEPLEKDIPADLGLSGSFGNSWGFGNGNRWGFMTAFKYDNKWGQVEEERRTYSAVGTEGDLQQADDTVVDRTINYIDTGLFANTGLELASNQKLSFNAMLLRQAADETKVTDGEQDSQVLRRTEFIWIENELLSYQLLGSHALPLPEWTLDWQYTDATAMRDEPNTRKSRRDDDDEDGIYIVSTRSDSNSQTWSELEDNLDHFTVDSTLPFTFGRHRLALTAGVSDLERDRFASIRTFSFQGRIPNDLRNLEYWELYTPDYIEPSILQLRESTRATDTYTATQTLEAMFLNLDVMLFDEQFRLTAGLREEDNYQEVVTANLANPDAPPVIGTIEQKDMLPSVAATWAYSDAAQFRAVYAESVNRPDFREMAPAPYLDPLLDIITVGNPDLVTAQLKNYDLRWEYYFSPSESFSVAAFYKDFTNPIEKTFSSGGSAKIITLQNALGAELSGVEFDYSQTLEWIGKVGWLNWLEELDWGFIGPFDWDNYQFSVNYAWIESSVEIDTSTTTQTNPDRPLQGQSPWVFNLSLGYYNPESPTEWTLLYNEFGARITQAGVLGQPDIYEEPYPQLDFVYKRRFGDDWRLSLKLKNLLDPGVEFTQGDEITRYYKRGVDISVGLEWSF
ncbi:outer membrane beta-barrel protein [Marinihelvus fidelis]|uniref:Outer membrane beta-barrel protein n=1 Tax=Marinihelvus fidelis TaxID=2613842 RepID=A0A5N0T4M0_9GAMM|nr:carboxypeptidase regulatory-like domain-containing protein [Marinihelvus fidelis]KAA9129853.1 outer membrane beta-barrel protein [Marinihelvus fidelis]